MQRPIRQWLETFMCGNLSEIFERYGYRTVKSIIHLHVPQLMSIGIPPKESELVFHHLQLLQQSLSGTQERQHVLMSDYGNIMSNRQIHDDAFSRENSVQQVTSHGVDSSSYQFGSTNSGPGLYGQLYSQGMSHRSDQMNSVYRQQYQGSNYPQQQQYTTNTPATSHNIYPGHVQGAHAIGQSNMRQSHPHLRNSGQNPQEVANNILHMASSSYPTNNTVQVPLSKHRSAPYHIPSRSPNFNAQMTESQHPMSGEYGPSHFVYPSPPHQSQQYQQSVREPRMSPVSPGPGPMMSSPHSHHSGRSISSSSPCSMHSPGMGHVRSPGPYSQMANSPQRNQYQISSPISVPTNRMPSPVSTSQQLQVSVPSSVPSQYHQQQCYGQNMAISSPYQAPNFLTISQFSPSSIQNMQQGDGQFNQTASNQGGHYCQSASGHSGQYAQSPSVSSQYCQSPSGHSSQYCQSPSGHSSQYCQSPSGQSGHLSNISSPYTPSSGNYLSPTQTHTTSASETVSDTSYTSSYKQCSSPLQSLQRLCMLPDSQVVDPKSVVKEACVPSPSPSSSDSPVQNPTDNVKTTQKSSSVNKSKYPSHGDDIHTSKMETASSVSPEMKCQPKKMMLLRAAKDDFTSTSEQSSHGGQTSETNKTVSSTKNLNTAKTSDTTNNKTTDERIKPDDINTDCKLNENNSMANNIDSNKVEIFKGESNGQEIEHKDISCDVGKKTSKTEDCEKLCTGEENIRNVADFRSALDSVNDSELEFKEADMKEHEKSVEASRDHETCDTDSKSCNVECVQSVDADGLKLDESVTERNSPVLDSDVISDGESQLHVRKDESCTYSKQDRLNSFDISSRKRADSTGSLSEISEFEYEDHIGCDDIETGFSDIDDRDNEIVEESGDDIQDVNESVPNGHKLLERVVIIGTRNKNGIKKKPNAVVKTKSGRIVKSRRVIMQMSEGDSDSGIPSPHGCDMVDGLEDPVSVDNGDGTISVRAGRVRQRKTPVKYKDTSFFQGDFVFVDEEEDFFHQDEPKRKVAKKEFKDAPSVMSPVVGLQNGKKVLSSGYTKISKTDTHTNDRSFPTKDKKIVIIPASKNIEKNIETTMKLISKQADKAKTVTKQLHIVHFDSKQAVVDQKGDAKMLKCMSFKPFELNVVKGEIKTDNSITSCSKVQKAKSEMKLRGKKKSKTAITQRSSSEESNVRKNGNIQSKLANKQMNGASAESLTSRNSSAKSKGKSNQLKTCDNVKKKNDLKDENVEAKTKPQEEIEVIEIISDDSNGADNTGAICETGTSVSNVDESAKSLDLDLQCDEIVSDKETSLNGFMFSLVEDEMVDEKLNDVEITATENIIEMGKDSESNEYKTFARKSSAKSTGSSTKNKNKSRPSSSKTSKLRSSSKTARRKVFIDEDPDFELGPIKKTIKSINIERTSDLIGVSKPKKKPDKWADFKGPKVVFDGKKDTPVNCVVINDPYDQTTSKKAKLTAQNVTRIEISQLPSDKSVVIPNSEALDSDKWVCALCGKHSAFKFLGDLFGPYTVETMSEDMLDLSPKVRLGSAKKRKSEDGQQGTSKGGRSGSRAASVTCEMNEWKEVWVHESCVVYSDGVFLLGSKIYGLQEAVRIASQTPCSHCQEMGAMIGCLNKGCQQKYHHACAQEDDCYMDEENFSLLCPKHKIRKLKQLEASNSSSVG